VRGDSTIPSLYGDTNGEDETRVVGVVGYADDASVKDDCDVMMMLLIISDSEDDHIWLRTDGRKDGRKEGRTERRTEIRTDGRTDNAKTISLRLWRGIITRGCLWYDDDVVVVFDDDYDDGDDDDILCRIRIFIECAQYGRALRSRHAYFEHAQNKQRSRSVVIIQAAWKHHKEINFDPIWQWAHPTPLQSTLSNFPNCVCNS
ncbi:hypothetical protein DPMN_014806, partial [Dreissena polymorpha]